MTALGGSGTLHRVHPIIHDSKAPGVSGRLHRLDSGFPDGPYQVTAIDEHGNLRLNIPRRYSRHPVFTLDMLKHYHDNPEHQRNIPEDEEAPLYTIERIIDHKITKDGKKYLIRWKGYDKDEDTWEPADNIKEDAPGSVEDYRDMLDELGE